MSILERYQQYAAAFEETYRDDDWSRLEQFFTEDAVYEFGTARAQGRKAVLEALENSVNGMDRRMDSRTPDFEPPATDGNTVNMSWQVTYRKSGLPDLVIRGREIAEFRGDRMALLRDEMDAEAATAMAGWMSEHGASLQAG